VGQPHLKLAGLDLTQPLAQPWGVRALALAPQARALLADALFPSPNPSYNLTKTDTVKAVRSRYMLNCEPYEVEMLTLRSNRVLNVTLLPGGWKSEIDLLQQLDWLEQDKAYCMRYSNWSLPDFNQTSSDCSAYVYTLFNYTNCTDPVTGAFISNSTNCTGNLSQTSDVPPPNPARDALFPEAGSALEVAATSYWTTPFPFGAGYRLLRRLAFGEPVADVGHGKDSLGDRSTLRLNVVFDSIRCEDDVEVKWTVGQLNEVFTGDDVAFDRVIDREAELADSVDDAAAIRCIFCGKHVDVLSRTRKT
jgi:hypothetical protein